MKIIFFSKNYTPHDYRFLSSLAQTEHEIFFLQLEGNRRQTEDRPIPEKVRQIPWSGGKGEFHWRDIPRLTFALRRLIREIKPDLIHSLETQKCGYLTMAAKDLTQGRFRMAAFLAKRKPIWPD